MSGFAASFARRFWLAATLSTAAGSALAQGAPAKAATSGTPHAAPAASPSPLLIDWQGPAECDRGASVRAKVLRLLGGSAALTTGIQVKVTVRHETGSHYVAELETTTAAGGGKKRLEGESCDAVALASSVVIALSLDPNASLDAEPEPEPEPETEPPKPEPRPRPRPAQKARPTESRDIFPYLHGSVGVLFGLLSIPSAFSSVGVGVRAHRFSLELGGALYQPREVSLVDRPNVGAELHLFTGELLGCFAALPFQLGAVELCPGFRLEVLSADAYGVSNPDRAEVVLASGVAAVRGRLRATSWLSATLDLGVAARPFQPKFVLLGVGDVFETPLLSPIARTGLILEF